MPVMDSEAARVLGEIKELLEDTTIPDNGRIWLARIAATVSKTGRVTDLQADIVRDVAARRPLGLPSEAYSTRSRRYEGYERRW